MEAVGGELPDSEEAGGGDFEVGFFESFHFHVVGIEFDLWDSVLFGDSKSDFWAAVVVEICDELGGGEDCEFSVVAASGAGVEKVGGAG